MSETSTAADRLYGSASRAAPSVDVATPDAVAADAVPIPPEQAKAAEPPSDEAALYPDAGITTRGYVKFDEPALADPASLEILIPGDLANPDPAATDRLRAAFVAAGAGPTTAREILADAVAAARQGTSANAPDSTLAELRRSWGNQTEARLAAARDLVRRATAHDPDIPDFLARTGLGNDAGFIRKLAARAMQRGGR